ncbi:hypothetical protein [Dolichospermum phage Dfl-JY14]
MKSAIAAGVGAFTGAVGAIALPSLFGSGLCFGLGVQLLLIAGGVRVDMPRVAAGAALGGWPLLLGAAAQILLR